jgi:PIN domain nuclease of toxin-antitoxin system
MKLLLDTHAFLWAVMAPEKLGRKARTAMESPGNEIFVSAITFWELSLKYSLGKLQLEGIAPDELPSAAEDAGFSLCTIEPQIAASFHQIPRIGHKDPFDRMLIWQAIQSDFTLLSKDSAMKHYTELGLKVLW